MATMGVLMRFRNSASTLPRVLEALATQSRQPDLLVGVDNGSSDGGREMLASRGAKIVDWKSEYHVSRVLNFGLRACPTDLVVVLSSHSVLLDTDVLARYEHALENPRVAAACHRHVGLSRYSDIVDLNQLRTLGMVRGSFYSNSVGCLRRSYWEEVPFDERISFAAEDYHWAITQLELGRVVQLLNFRHEHIRPGVPRGLCLKTSRIIRAIAREHRLRVAQLNPGGDLSDTLHAIYWFLRCLGRDPLANQHIIEQLEWLKGGIDWRRYDPFRDPGGCATVPSTDGTQRST